MAKIIDPRATRDLSTDVIDQATGCLKVMPASYYQATTIDDRAVLGARHAFYGLPTTELIEWIKSVIGDRSAIEIGSGNGVLAQALGIPGTDSHMQERPDIVAVYTATGQRLIKYGATVENLDYAEAIKKHKPQVVVASWVTHRYRADRHDSGGNMYGVVEEDVIDSCETYIFIGNSTVHKGKSIWTRPHTLLKPDWLFSRAHNGSPEFLAVWNRPTNSTLSIL